MKRSKDRRELSHSSSFRHRRSVSPHVAIDECSNPESLDAIAGLLALNTHHVKPLIGSDVPVSLNPFVVRRERSSSSCSYTYRGSPYQISCPNGEVQNIRRNSDPNSHGSLIMGEIVGSNGADGEGVDDDDDDQDEQPLDMSKKSRTSSDSESLILPRSQASTPDLSGNMQQMRPSVITCAPSFRPKLATSPNCSSCSLSNEFEKCATDSKSVDKHSTNGHNCETGNVQGTSQQQQQRRQILSGACDPVIDEHFRRSLGKEYSELFVKSNQTQENVSVSMSVDDHFAKALGETWTKLQGKDKESSTNKFNS